ncbi:MAG: hypothetical protein QNK23_05210 [Crocinitomicaceae bacterium]|nr:hypothetical protein [Crocinitomicaceae bacterium]
MKNVAILILMVVCSLTTYSQGDCHIDFKTPPVLIAGVRYQVSIPLNSESANYTLLGHGVTTTGANDSIILIANHSLPDSTYSLDLVKITNEDTIVISTQIFDVVQMPSPELLLGKYRSNAFIHIHKDSIDEISSLKLAETLSENQQIGWYKLFGVVKIEGFEKEFYFDGHQLSEEILHQFSLLNKPTQVDINLTFRGSDQTMRTQHSVFTIQSMSDIEWNYFNYPFYKLYMNKNVEIIGESSFYHQDTIVIDNSGELYIHCLGDSNGNNLTYEFESLDASDNFSVHKIIGKKEKLKKMANKKGRYRVTLFFNETLYDDLILIIN